MYEFIINAITTEEGLKITYSKEYFDSLFEFVQADKKSLNCIKSEIVSTFQEKYSISQSAIKYIHLFKS